MNLLPGSIVLTRDGDLLRRLSAFLHDQVAVRPAVMASELDSLLHPLDPALVFLDLAMPETRDVLARLPREYPDSLVICLAKPLSDPALEAEAMGVYAVESPDVGRAALQALVRRAQAHLRLAQENRLLKSDVQTAAAAEPPIVSQPRPSGAATLSLHHFSRAFRHFENVDVMLDRIAEGISVFTRASRVGIFALERDREAYRCRAGVKCLADTQALHVHRDDPLVRWLGINAQMIARPKLASVADLQERMLLKRSLDALGAEVLVPLHGRERLIGWIFVGHHITGVPYSAGDLDDLMDLAEHASLTLENALLYEEVALQKTLAETVLHSIPVGIVAADADGTVRWCNQVAERILETPMSEVIGRPVSRLGSRIADLISRCATGDETHAPVEWLDPLTGRTISLATRRLVAGGNSLGAVTIIADLTEERQLRDKEEQLERTSFWTELAAAMSHEIRNPLVAISTFAQLLPERYEDADFREKFSVLVSREIGRLNAMIDQINAFADPPALEFGPLRIDSILKKAVRVSLARVPEGRARVEHDIEPGISDVWGDEASLVDSFAHLVANALEATLNVPQPVVEISARTLTRGNEMSLVVVTVADNGPGMPEEIRGKAFSPFCTMKARGIGLGLPIVRRSVTDHTGEIAVESSDHGTRVIVTLPAAQREAAIEAHSCSR